ncbi:hypothetical protein [Desulfotignum phosphitoxidans]|uniref:Uncharacterized protein n=1 Tax=Desulfotignum phosphitoxidans DSM 13687 TaxID=1286635 RepID=S0G0M6_9BACT|nr:hypothetical protein [Desulfotignum phosphitoxidans]EMS77191.1 hypothetical protein Dpo_22c00100 [Desulfotignum phosphitoxidans DSM 13687]
MQYIEGVVLHRKSFQSKKGKEIPVVSILDEYDKFSQVVDITDFDNHVNGVSKGIKVRLPVRSRPGVSDRGNAFINYVVAGPVVEVTD